MAQRHPDGPRLARSGTAGQVLAAYLGDRAAEFLRALRLWEEDEAAALGPLCAAAQRISASLHTYEPLVDGAWAESLRTELDWLCATVAREQRYGMQLTLLRTALQRLVSGEMPGGRDGTPPGSAGTATGVPQARVPGAVGTASPAARRPVPAGVTRGPVAVGAARAGALLERQLTLARTRARTATLQALRSSRFHGIADAVALLASELPVAAAASAPAAEVLVPLAEHARRRLTEAADALPLSLASHPYNTYARWAALSDASAEEVQDSTWHCAQRLLRRYRYALEVLGEPADGTPDTARLYGAGRTLDRHQDAADAATAVAAAARTPRITPGTAFALGVLHADQRAEVEAARYAFSRLWQGLVPASTP